MRLVAEFHPRPLEAADAAVAFHAAASARASSGTHSCSTRGLPMVGSIAHIIGVASSNSWHVR